MSKVYSVFVTDDKKKAGIWLDLGDGKSATVEIPVSAGYELLEGQRFSAGSKGAVGEER